MMPFRAPMLSKTFSGGGGLDATNTKLLLHFDGADGSSTFIDSSAYAHSLSHNDLTHSTSQSVFGGSSGFFDGAGDRVNTSVPDDPDFAITSSPFAMFVWVRPTSLKDAFLFNKGATGSGRRCFIFETTSAGALRFQWSNTGTGYTGSLTSATSLLVVDTWQLVGVTRTADNTIRLFHGLISDDEIAVASSLNDATTAQVFHETTDQRQVVLGCNLANGFAFAGFMDEAVYIVGEALHEAAFARPTAPWAIAT